ncbi:hypothetical protein HDK90DRAFT_463274 [Phyllosticta capitalensis]|uniref:Uncharacterized protein n=1 Tax=Phyllosticta capitalensis TaxID=121624 RepID=A0ABR1Z1J4_9PEZI
MPYNALTMNAASCFPQAFCIWGRSFPRSASSRFEGHLHLAAFVAMLRYRATEIQLTAQDIDDASKRLAARRAAGNTRSAPCKIAPPENPGPRLRRGPERSRDDSVVHQDAFHGPQACLLEAPNSYSPAQDPKAKTTISAKQKHAQRDPSCSSANDASGEDECTSDLEDLSSHPTRGHRLKKRTANQAPPLDKAAFDLSSLGRSLPQYDGSVDHRGTLASTSQLHAKRLSKSKNEADLYQRALKHENNSTLTKPSQRLVVDESRTRNTKAALTWDEIQAARASSPKPGNQYRASNPRNSMDLLTLQEALDHASPVTAEPIPIIRFPSTSSTLRSSDSERRRHSLPSVANVSPFGTLSHSPSVSQISEHSTRNSSVKSSFLFRNTSTPDLLRPLLGVPSIGSTSSNNASAVPSRENSPTLYAAMLDLISRESSPLESLEKESRSQIPCAPSSMSRVSPRASQDSRAPLIELRMPTFESPERMSPPPRRVPRHRHSPSPRRPMPAFAEIPHSNFSSLDVLPSFSFDSSPPQPSGGFIERYPTAAGSRTLRTLSPHMSTASMPSLQPPPEQHSRRRASGNAHVQVARVHAQGRTIQQAWSPAVDSAASTAMAVATAAAHAAAAATESRRNTLDVRRPQRYRSVSARLLPPWQDEQENSGRAERQAMMAEIQARRRYMEQTDDGRIDRTPPSLGTYERRAFQH